MQVSRMAQTLGLVGFVLIIVAVLLWAGGAGDALQGWAIAKQEAFRGTLAAALRALRAGQPGAVLALVSTAFAYGLAHAAGPGHGKVLLGGYGLTGRAGAMSLIGLSLAASLAQATTAVFLVYGGILALGWGRERITSLAEGRLEQISYTSIALLGLWIGWRGFRHLQGMNSARGSQEHGEGHGNHCHAGCDHRHGPSIDDINAVGGLRDALMLIGSIAIRPCTGAIFLLILCWQLGLDAAGIAAAYAMGIGTALVTIMIVLAAQGARGTFAIILANRTGRFLPAVEIIAGGIILLSALRMLFPPG